MRITYKMMTGNYTDNLNKQSVELDRLNTQVSTGRRFSRTSEDTSRAIRAYQVRKDMAKIEGYQENIEFAGDFISNTESTMNNVEDSLSNAMDKILQGMNGTTNEDDRKIIANELRTIQQQILETLNTTITDTYIFGGSNTTERPFTVDDTTGKLLYNGVDLDDLTSDSSNTDLYAGTSPIPNNAAPTKYEVYQYLKEDSLYVDIGLGVDFYEAPDPREGQVNRNTVFNYSTTGISFVGSGTTDIDGTVASNNIYNLLGEIATEFEKNDGNYSFDTLDTLYGQFQTVKQSSYQTTTELGSKTNYLDFMTERYDTQMLNQQTRQNDIEGIDTAEAYISYTTQQVAYQAALKMGTEIIQQSVFDYMS
ncbi:flagellar hook-associated protein FlgL [Eubacteriaceae bacterium ES3]|nr:flagellar hook-associated protein FlgL [Eubacteriaceae bacterium ES3]